MKRLRLLLLLFAASAACLLVLCACAPSKASVTFKLDETESIVVTVNDDKKAFPPYVECAEGVYVEGWYVDSGLTIKFDFSQTVEDDITLYPKYMNAEYTARFDLNYPDCKNPPQATFTREGNLVLPAEPVRVGYEFLGWSDGSALYRAGAEYDAQNALCNLVFSASWRYKVLTVTLLNGEGELIEKVEVPYNGSVAPNDVLVQESDENSWCFDVIGWDKSITNVKEDVTASAIYKYVPTDDFYFKFSLNEDKVSYSLAGLTTGSVPAKTALPDTYRGLPVTRLKKNAFSSNMTLTDLYIPSSYETIESGACRNCYMLKNVTLENGVKKLGLASFSGYNLSKVTLPDTLLDWGIMPFGTTTAIEYVLKGDNVNYVQEDGIIYDVDKTAVYVGSSTASGDIVFPETVTRVKAYAFVRNKSITGLTFKGHIDAIEWGAFFQCPYITDLVFEKGVKKISGVDSEQGKIFAEKYDYEDGGDFNLNGAFFRSCCGSLWDEETFESLGFATLENLVLKGIEKIGDCAFQDCNIRNLKIDKTVRYIGEAAFTNSGSDYIFTSVSMLGADENDFYAIKDDCIVEKGSGPQYLGKNGDRLLVYAQNSSAVQFDVPEGVTYISPFAFAELKNLETVTLPEGITELYGWTFSAVLGSSLKSVLLPSTLVSLRSDTYVFGEVQLMGITGGVFTGCENLSDVEFRGMPSLEYIGANTFYVTALREFEIPASVAYVGFSAFLNEYLVSLSVEDGNEVYVADEGVLYTKDMTTLVCYPSRKAATSYTVPEGVAAIEGYSCEATAFLETLVIGGDVKKVGQSAFYNAHALKEITFKGNVEMLGQSAFFGAPNLKKVIFEGEKAPFLGGSHNGTYSVFASGYDSMTWEAILLCEFVVPQNAIASYYSEFYLYAPAYAEAIDLSEISDTAYTLKKDGETVAVFTDSLVKTEPTCEGSGYFQGWYLSDGSADGDWGERVEFPAYFEQDTITLYARFGEQRVQDGKAWGRDFELDANGEALDVTFKNGRAVYFRFTAPRSGSLNLLYDGLTGDEFYLQTDDVSGVEYVVLSDYENPQSWCYEIEEGKTYFVSIKIYLFDGINIDCSVSFEIV